MQKGDLSEHVARMHNADIHRHIFRQQFVVNHLADDDVTSDDEIHSMCFVMLTHNDAAGTVVLEIRYGCQFLFHVL